MNITNLFFRYFFSIFLGIILLVNIDMYMSMVAGVNAFNDIEVLTSWDFNYNYFGFTSFLNAVEGLGNVTHIDILYADILDFGDMITRFTYVIRQFEVWDIEDWINGFITFLTTFASFTLNWFEVIYDLLRVVTGLIYWVMLLLCGYFNTPIPIIS